MKKVRLGIIGAGNMGSGHIGNYLKGLLPEIEIVAVADRRPDRRDWARENLGDKVAIFNEGSDLIASGLVDACRTTSIRCWPLTALSITCTSCAKSPRAFTPSRFAR